MGGLLEETASSSDESKLHNWYRRTHLVAMVAVVYFTLVKLIFVLESYDSDYIYKSTYVPKGSYLQRLDIFEWLFLPLKIITQCLILFQNVNTPKLFICIF